MSNDKIPKFEWGLNGYEKRWVWFNFILNGYLNVFEKMHLEESISKIKLISNELCCEKLKPFCESLDEITTITPFSVQHFDDNKSK